MTEEIQAATPAAPAANRADLIIAALQEEISQKSGQVAVYRADITMLATENKSLKEENDALKEKLAAAEYSASLSQ